MIEQLTTSSEQTEQPKPSTDFLAIIRSFIAQPKELKKGGDFWSSSQDVDCFPSYEIGVCIDKNGFEKLSMSKKGSSPGGELVMLHRQRDGAPISMHSVKYLPDIFSEETEIMSHLFQKLNAIRLSKK